MGVSAPAALARFAIGFDERDRPRLHALWDEVITSQRWSEGPMTERFESAWAAWNGVQVAAVHAGAHVEFVDANRDDLCMSFEDFEAKVARHRPRAAFLVHIGGHIAFEVEAIADLCRAEGIFLIEDCAHAHGASWHGRRPGTWGDAGVWSFYATKTVSTGEGGILASRHDDLLAHARAFRNYGKPDHAVPGLNFRPSEFTAALGVVQAERMEEIVAWKNAAARRWLDPRHPGRLRLPDGMTSGLYKYVTFDPIERSAGRGYERPCHP